MILQEHQMLPLHINIKGKSAVIAGGGDRGAASENGAGRTCVCNRHQPRSIRRDARIDQRARHRMEEEKAEPGDFKDAFLIILATDDHEVNKRIAASAAPDQLVNVASEAELGNVYVPKIINRGNITISVSTNGASPRHTIKLAGQIEDLIDDELVQEIDELLRKRRGLNQ